MKYFYSFLFYFIFSAHILGQSNPIEVMSWVPPYAIPACQTAVQANFGTCDAKDGLTRIGLQFWTPNTDGTIKYANHEFYTPTDADVNWWKTWAAANNVELLLCIYNNIGSWDWSLAVSAFDTNRTTFINALIAEMNRLGLDGIDLDLEGVGAFDSNRAAFKLFVQELSAQLKLQNKILTIDSFHYIWNAPNQNWWVDWIGLVDNIHTMGYTDLYEASTTAYGPFSFQQNTGTNAGYPSNMVSMGLPTWVGSWGTSSGRGTTAQAHIQEIRYDIAAPTGIALWDLQLQGWQNSALWCEIQGLKNEPVNLPVELISFQAKKTHQYIDLAWETASEVNHLGFEIQWKTPNSDWTKIGWIGGTNPSGNRYTFKHRTPLLGDNYYRLKQMDVDEKFTYSLVVTEKFYVLQALQIYPNPAKTSIRFFWSNPLEEKTTIQILNLNQQVIREIFLSKESVEYSINIQDFSNGIYFAKINNGTSVELKKFIVQR